MKVGDKVKVNKIGGFYSTYRVWAETVGAERWVKNKYPENMEFVIKAIAPHITESITLYLLSNDEGEFIFDNIDSNITIVRRTRTEYEKVTESIFDLRDEFERGELYYNFGDDEWFTYKDEASLAIGFKEGNVHRKVEKEIDERQEFVDLAISKIDHTNSDDPSYYAGWFEQLYDAGCRFVLANGEIE